MAGECGPVRGGWGGPARAPDWLGRSARAVTPRPRLSRRNRIRGESSVTGIARRTRAGYWPLARRYLRLLSPFSSRDAAAAASIAKAVSRAPAGRGRGSGGSTAAGPWGVAGEEGARSCLRGRRRRWGAGATPSPGGYPPRTCAVGLPAWRLHCSGRKPLIASTGDST